MKNKFSDSIKYLTAGDIGHCFLFLLVLPVALVAKIFIRNFWLVCEDRNEARDNGYHFFRWVRANRPKQKIAYAINKQSPDYQKVKDIGKVISYGTLSHWFWYIVADRNISSQKGGKPNAAVCYLLEVVFKLRKNNRVFLQHGVIINRLDWLFYNDTYMRLFITSALDEQEYVSTQFGYPAGYVQLLGLSRFDSLSLDERDEKIILVMPTWRNWLGRASSENKDLDFTATEYYKKWSEFIADKRLAQALEKHGTTLIFYPHRNMQKFIGHFVSDSNRIVIADWKTYDIQTALKQASLMITDYSSVFFDFSYMRKPVLFYQFDEEEFRARQYGQGYFDYKNTVLGKWTDDKDKLVDMIEESMSNGNPLLDERTVEKFFPYIDTKNSERIYESITNLNKKQK
ncbi:MAG: CDP-glycerol glycerophosphotransferase family protein [Clostridia bacterium]|nr:CDP-glycerol glycerophosphotransferase family protein [Clostridia bacterium]